MALPKKIPYFAERVSQKFFLIRINWPFLLAFVVFWSYGWQPIITRNSLMLQVGVAVYAVCILSIYLKLGLSKASVFSSIIKLSLKDCLILVVVVGIWIAIGFFRLQEPISGDQFYYSLGAKAHELYIARLFEDSTFTQAIELKYFVHAIDALIFIAGALALYFLNRLEVRKPLFYIVAVFILLSMRFFSLAIGIESSPHPPFQLFPIWLCTSILGVSEISLRLPQYVGLIGCSGFTYWIFRERLGSFNSLALSISICSIPLYLHVASMVEGSGWTTLLMFILITKIIFQPPKDFSSWFGLSAMICIFTLMRLTAFLMFPIFIIFYLQQRKINKNAKSPNEVFLLLLPLLVSLPFFVTSLAMGTPATYIPGEAEYISESSSALNRLLYALKGGVIYDTSISAIGGFWLVFILGATIRDVGESAYLKNRILISALFIIFVAAFFSIRPVLWGADRYKAEYLVPFIMLGMTLILLKIYDLKATRRVFLLFAFGLIIVGVLGFARYPEGFVDPLANSRFERQSEIFYDYKSALKDARSAGLSERVILVGVTYGVMPQILSGYSLLEVKKSKRSYDQFHSQRKLGKSIGESLAVIPEIDLVLLMDPNGLNDQVKLAGVGWTVWKDFYMDHGHQIFALKRTSK